MLHPQRTALVVIDVQKAAVMDGDFGIPLMPGGAERVARTVELVEAARAAGVPPIFIQEVHKPTLIDFGRELDGTETVHVFSVGRARCKAGRATVDGTFQKARQQITATRVRCR